MRRGSLFAPLLLIALGVLFLVRNIYRDVPLFDYLAKYWPFLLILWGGLRLAEIVFWASTNRPLPSRGVSGGEWLLVLLICFFGVSLQAVLGFSTWFPRERFVFGGLDMFGETYNYPLAAEKPSSKSPRIVIENFRGNARITGTDTDTVKVSGRKDIRSMDQSGADSANEQTPLELTGDANRVVIRTNQDRASGPTRVTADMEIAVPRGASIEAQGAGGDFDINDVEGTVNIDAERGGVRLQNIGGDARLDLRRSDIVRAVNLKGALDLKGAGSDIDLENIGGQVTINGSYTGNVQFQNLGEALHFVGPQTEFAAAKVPGQIRMPLGNFNASNLVGPARLQTRSRDVQISDFTNSLEVSSQRGDIELRPGSLPLAKIDVRTHAGNITLALPPEAQFDLNASTGRGEVRNDFGSSINVEQSGRGATMRTSGGGPPVTAHTDLGEITVRKASPDEPPLLPRSEPRFGTKQGKRDKSPRRPLKRIEQ